MPEIVTVPTEKIATNPYRRLHDYPYVQSKLDALQRSIAEVGLWPSVIARPLEDRLWQYELAFGHHRIEAARRFGLREIPLIVENLSDRQMLQYMGRENLEDYNAIFLIQLESWEATVKSGLLSTRVEKTPQPIEIAKLLGWVRIQGGKTTILNQTAEACHAAYALIEGGYMARSDFANLTVKGALDIAERALARIEQLDRIGRNSARSAHEIEAGKRYIGRGASDTARQLRAGLVPAKETRNKVDFNAGIRAGRGSKPSPLFAVFANAIADNLKRTLHLDSDASKLAEIEKVLPQINMLEDWEALRRLDVELLNLGKRTEGWRRRLTPSQEKIIQLKALEGGKGK